MLQLFQKLFNTEKSVIGQVLLRRKEWHNMSNMEICF